MDATELRIGNKAIFTDFPSSGIKTIDGSDIKRISEDKYFAGFFDPAPLTEEWLVKFGFDKLVKENKWNHQVFRKGQIELYVNSYNKLGITFEFECYQKDIDSIDLKFVHQLQNLYFALTNEELTIK